MTDTLLQDSPVTAEHIIEITREAWSSFLKLDLEPMDPDTVPVDGPRCTGVVNISGAWQGSAVLECSATHAVAAA